MVAAYGPQLRDLVVDVLRQFDDAFSESGWPYQLFSRPNEDFDIEFAFQLLNLFADCRLRRVEHDRRLSDVAAPLSHDANRPQLLDIHMTQSSALFLIGIYNANLPLGVITRKF
jgi:hypothetical protein